MNSGGMAKIGGMVQTAAGAYTGNPGMVAGGLDQMRGDQNGTFKTLEGASRGDVSETPLGRAMQMKSSIGSLSGGAAPAPQGASSGAGQLGAMKARQQSMMGFM
jgi:hypothetical protein